MADIDIAAIAAEDAAAVAAKTAETAPPAEGDTAALAETTGDAAAPPGDEPPAPAKPPGIPVERFKTETAKRREAERRAERAEETLRQALAGRTAPTAPPADGEPRQDQFRTYEEYLDARTDYRAEKKAQAMIGEILTASQKEAAERSAAESGGRLWSEMAKEAKAKGIEGLDDAREAMASGEVKTTPAMARYFEKVATNKAALAVYLHQNPEEAERISGLDAVEAATELARRDGLLGRKPAVTKAPAPPPTVTGGGMAPQTVERMSHDDIKAWAMKQQRGR